MTAKGDATEVVEPVMTPAELEADIAPYAPEDLRGELALSLRPEEVEAVIGPLQWEERREDGALCALLSPNEAEKVMELAYKQSVPLEIGQPAGGEPEVWILILIP